MDTLLEKMNAYWSNHEATEESGGLMFFKEDTADDTGELVRLMWEHLFIGSWWNHETTDFLGEHGYKFRTFEKDSFGILMAGIGKDGKWFSIG